MKKGDTVEITATSQELFHIPPYNRGMVLGLKTGIIHKVYHNFCEVRTPFGIWDIKKDYLVVKDQEVNG